MVAEHVSASCVDWVVEKNKVLGLESSHETAKRANLALTTSDAPPPWPM